MSLGILSLGFSVAGLCGCFFYFLRRYHAMLAAANLTVDQLRQDLKEAKEQSEPVLLDSVTDLPAWVLFEDRVKYTIAESERSQPSLMAGILLIDINDFGMIADGLDAGETNELLKAIGQRLRPVLRKIDTISRYQQASFVILVTQLGKPETAAIVAQRILRELTQPFYTSKREIYLNVSIGISIYPADGGDLAALLQAAQSAAQSAAKTVHDSDDQVYHFYQEKNQFESQRELLIHLNIKRESVFQELVLYYQPVVNSKTQSLMCMDVLLKWQHPSLGLIDSDELFHHIDRQRKQASFTEWMLKAACRQYTQWRQSGLSLGLLGIPMSIRQLKSTPFIYRFAQIMQSCEFDPKWLLLELKETDADVSFDLLEKAFNMLNYLGVQIAVRLEGDASFSFIYLRRIKMTYLMLSDGFINDIEENPRTLGVVKGLFAMTRELDCHLVVRGVETDAQAAMLSAVGCDFLQGRLLGEAVKDSDVKVKMAPLL